MSLVIPPTTGRRVLLFIASIAVNAGLGAQTVIDAAKPFDAGIAYVHGDDRITVGYTDHAGLFHSATSVKLYDRAQDTTDAHGKGETYAVWMPYQFDQALRAQAPSPVRGDVELVKLADNGRPVPQEAPPQSLPRAEGLENASGEELRAVYGDEPGAVRATSDAGQQ